MKRAILLASLIFSITFTIGVSFSYAYTSPGKPQGFVSDYANIFSTQGKITLEQKLFSLNGSTTIQIAVVTITSLDDETIESYAVKLFKEWGIGQKDKNNGVLFLTAINDRKVRIEVGYGLEGVLTDAQSNGIIQNIVLPEFRNSNYEGGIIKGTDAIISVVQSEADYSSQSQTQDDNKGFSVYTYFFIIIWGSGIILRILSKTRAWWLGGVIGAIGGIIIGLVYGFLYGGIVAVIILSILGFIIDYIVSKHPPRGGRGGGFWGGFGGGGSSGGGGFGGFGGGSSGGGGASGGW